MKILFINTVSTLRCGVSEFGRTMFQELARRGADVVEYDGSYPSVYHRGHQYFPPDLSAYDWVHFNWHPVTLNHYQPELLPHPHPRISVYLHDLPPWSSCALALAADIRIAAEPFPSTYHLPYPAVADAAEGGAVDLRPITIGWSGIRGDGREALAQLCARRGWTFNGGDLDLFLATREEIRRLAHSTLNVLWYTASGRGQSLALMTAAAARRPLLINQSLMFASAARYRHEIYCAGHAPASPYLEQAIDTVLDQIWKGEARVPRQFLRDFSWASACDQLLEIWEGAPCVSPR